MFYLWNKRLFLSWSERNSSWYTVNFVSCAAPPMLKWSFLLKPISTSHFPDFKSLSMKLYFCSVKYRPWWFPTCTWSFVEPTLTPSNVFGFVVNLCLWDCLLIFELCIVRVIISSQHKTSFHLLFSFRISFIFSDWKFTFIGRRWPELRIFRHPTSTLIRWYNCLNFWTFRSIILMIFCRIIRMSSTHIKMRTHQFFHCWLWKLGFCDFFYIIISLIYCCHAFSILSQYYWWFLLSNCLYFSGNFLFSHKIGSICRNFC